ncbi:MAG: radical SAM protein [Clostridia bacterium]|nr:radical SAM protein [Clostridia bacterium]
MESGRHCTLCPRRCGADRSVRMGYCGAGDAIRLARAMPHFWEEPCISGSRGSGTIFFSGCTLRCVFCQNRAISTENFGKEITPLRFRQICFELKAAGVHNINLVTPDAYARLIVPVLEEIKAELALPIVINCGGYLSPEQVELLGRIADVWLPDFKYADGALAARLSGAGDYPEVALSAIREMVDRAGKPTFDRDGMLQKGVLVRHLVLPGERKNSIAAIERLAKTFAPDEILLSLMAQYTPNGAEGAPNRRITTFEYRSVMEAVEAAGFEGYCQSPDSARREYTPEFGLQGVEKTI